MIRLKIDYDDYLLIMQLPNKSVYEELQEDIYNFSFIEVSSYKEFIFIADSGDLLSCMKASKDTIESIVSMIHERNIIVKDVVSNMYGKRWQSKVRELHT